MGLESLEEIKHKQKTLTKTEFEKDLLQKSVSLATEEHKEADVEIRDFRTAQLMLNDVRNKMHPADATGAADGAAVMAEAHRKKGYKERRDEKKKVKEARKITGLRDADINTYTAGKNLIQYAKEKDASMKYLTDNPELEQKAKECKLDGRLLRSWTLGYRTDEKGNPLNDFEAEKKAADEELIRDMVSGKLADRKKHLDRMTDSLLGQHISTDMLTPEYIAAHTADLRNLCSRMTSYQNIFDDPINEQYFKDMEPIRLELVKTRILDVSAILSNAMTQQYNYLGVDINSDGFAEPASATRLRQVSSRTREEAINLLGETLETNRAKEAQIFEKYQGNVLTKAAGKAAPPAIKEGSLKEEARKGFIDSFKNGALTQSDKKFDAGLKQAEAEAKEEITQRVKADAAKNIKWTEEQVAKELKDTFDSKMNMVESDALQAIGIRSESNATCKAYKAYAGGIIDAVSTDLKEMAKAIVSEKIDVSLLSQQVEKISLIPLDSPGAVMSGGGLGALTQSFMTVVGKHLMSENSIKLFADAYEAFGSAHVFRGSLENFVLFFAQGIMTNVNGVFSLLKADYTKTPSEDTPFVQYMANAGITMLGTAGLAMRDDRENVKKLLAEKTDVGDLMKQYKEIIAQVTALVKAKIEKTGAQGAAGPANN